MNADFVLIQCFQLDFAPPNGGYIDDTVLRVSFGLLCLWQTVTV